MTFWHIFRFELAHHARRRSTWLYFAVVMALAIQITNESFVPSARSGSYFFNAPIVIAAITAMASMFGLLIAAAVAGEAATRDMQTRMEPLLYTTPLRKSAYLGGRYLAALTMNALLMAAVPLALMVAGPSAQQEPELVGPFRTASYIAAYALVALPNAFVATAILFAAAALSRRALASYVGAALLFLLGIVSNAYVAKYLSRWELGKLLDPFGFTVMSELSRVWTPAQKNALLLTLDGSLLSNRILWIGIGMAALALTHVRFRVAHHGADGAAPRFFSRKAAVLISDAPKKSDGPIAVPPDRRTFRAATGVRQMLVVARRSFIEVITTWGALAFGAVVIVWTLTAPELLEHLGVPMFPTTKEIIDLLTASGDLVGFITPLLTVFYARELVWRERDARASDLTDTTPAADWVLLAGKFLGLSLMLAAFQALRMICGIATQVRLGYYDFEPGLYLQILFGMQLIDLLLFAALAVAVHVVVHQKYVAHLVTIVAFALTRFWRDLGIEHNLLLYGSDPGWQYSDISGFDPYLEGFFWFKLYWGAGALLLGVIARLLWVRGRENHLRARLQLARRRLTSATGWTLGAAGVFALTGVFIFYNTNVLNAYVTADESQARRAEYERRYGRYEGVPQPALTATSLRIELYPERRLATIRGTYTLLNETRAAIDTIHLATSSEVTTGAIDMDRPFAAAAIDDALGHRVYTLKHALQRGESLRLTFDVRFAPRGFPNRGISTAVVCNGTHFEQDLLPAIGYQPERELSNDGDRKKHALPARPETHEQSDAQRNRRSPRIDFNATIGTAANQIAIAPGALRRTWTQNGRRYFHYATDAPIRNGYAIFSADYRVHRGTWRDGASGRTVDIEIVHHPGHAWKLAGMVRSVQASLDYFTTKLGPYPHRQLRLVEAPGASVSLRSHPINIRYFEGFALLNPEADDRGIDFPFAVVAHEVAHQWWGNQLSPADVEGAALLSESLAWYSAIGVIEKEYGSEHLQRFLDLLREAYLTPRSRADVPLLRARDHFSAYRKGPLTMYALRESIGEQQVDLALRRLFEKYRSGAPPRATSLDLYRELEAVTPAALRPLLVDLFAVNTFWDLSTREATASPAGAGAWRVKLDVSARKVAVDEQGKESARAMNDMIEIGVFGRDAGGRPGKPLYLRKHAIRAGQQRITVVVPAEPARAGIDPRNVLLDTVTHDNTVEVRD